MKGATIFALCAVLMCSACVDTTTFVSGYVGDKPIGFVRVQQFLYGQLNYSNTLYGIIQTGNLDIGFQQLTNMFTTLVAAYVAGDVAKAKEVTSQLASAGATKVQIKTIDSAAKQAATALKAGNVSKGIDAGLFQQGGTVFKQ